MLKQNIILQNYVTPFVDAIFNSVLTLLSRSQAEQNKYCLS